MDPIIIGVIDKGHWIEVIGSIFKAGNTDDSSIGDELIRHIQAVQAGQKTVC
jgi:hypothetical protein